MYVFRQNKKSIIFYLKILIFIVIKIRSILHRLVIIKNNKYNITGFDLRIVLSEQVLHNDTSIVISHSYPLAHG